MAGVPSRAMILFGTEEEVVPLRRLVAGPLTVDLDRGNLRYVRWGGREILRGIAFIVRDTRWGTYSPLVADLVVTEGAERFAVSYSARCSGEEGAFSYRAEIEGSADGRLAFRASGASPGGFGTCRTGFVVLHPLDGVAGHAVEVEHASGGRSAARFPAEVDPSQPIFDIRALGHEPWPGTRVTVRMEGDAFEMEDHRNWTDASFKTYVRPLSRGYPYRIEPGELVEQSVTVEVAGPPPASPVRAGAAEAAALSLGGPRGRVPRVGLFLPPTELESAGVFAARVSALRPSYVIGRIDLRVDDPAAVLSALRSLAGAMGAPLGIEVVIPGIAPSAELAPLGRAIGAPLDSILVVPARDLKSRPGNTTPAGEASAAAILAAVRGALPGQRIGGGMTVAFPEFNRNRPPRGVDFITHATQALMHAADDISVMETLESLSAIVRSGRAIAGDIPCRLGPATIGSPASASASAPSANPGLGRVTMAGTDPRQRGLFAAAFALGYAATAAREGVDSLTLAAPAGSFGVFDAETGVARPIAAVVGGLGRLAGAPLIEATVSGSIKVAALAAGTPSGPVVWLANLGPERIAVHLGGASFRTLRVIEADALARGPADAIAPVPLGAGEVTLDSFAVCCLE